MKVFLVTKIYSIIFGPKVNDTLCYATQVNQDDHQALQNTVDTAIVVVAKIVPIPSNFIEFVQNMERRTTFSQKQIC